MPKIFVSFHTGYVGMDGHTVIEFPDDFTDEDIDEELYIQAIQHASSYGVEVCDCDDNECELEHSHNVCASWELYDANKHNKYLHF
jgi:hypothetical protein